MSVELTSEQRNLLLQLVSEAIREIGPEIRHTMTSTYKDDLKQQRRALRHLRDVLSAPAVGLSAEFTSPGLIGTP